MPQMLKLAWEADAEDRLFIGHVQLWQGTDRQGRQKLMVYFEPQIVRLIERLIAAYEKDVELRKQEYVARLEAGVWPKKDT